MRPGCWRWNNISLPFPELHSIDSIALGLVIYNAKTVPASAGRRKMALYFHISFHDVQVSSQHYYSLNIAQRMYCLFFQRSVHSYHHLLHCHHLYSIHEGEWNRVCGKFLFPSHLVMFRHTRERTSWPYFGVKLRKKLPIVTLRWPNVTLMWTTVALR